MNDAPLGRAEGGPRPMTSERLSCAVARDVGQPAHRLTPIDSSRPILPESGDAALLAAAGFKRSEGEVAFLPRSDGIWEAFVGVSDVTALGVWDLAAAADKLPAGTYRLSTGRPDKSALGWLLAHYRFDCYRRDSAPADPRILLLDDAEAIDEAIELAAAIGLVRDLVNMPANALSPSALAAAVRCEGEAAGAVVEIITADALVAGYPAVHAVGRGSASEPCLADLRWGSSDHPKLTIVGKGVCFDSGGLNIKDGKGLLHMKGDMGGAAHALALARLVMRTNLPVHLRLLIPAVENMLSGSAYRPSDILATRAGLSVEVGNTDAEGRLILCDALAAADEERPDLIIDFATLTGAARAALGRGITAMFTNRDDLAADLARAGGEVEDPVWRLPLWQPYRELLKSDVADLVNVQDPMLAGSITAALFLQTFLHPDQPWVHLDIYGWSAEARPGRPKGGDATGLAAAWQMLKTRYGAGMTDAH